MIDSRDISVVVQGAVDTQLTHLTLASIRRVLPKATIILSTWEGTATKHLDADVVIYSTDPGSSICDEVYNVRNNVNRQIVSTLAGVKRVETLYSLKLRSDMVLSGTAVLSAFEKFADHRTPECKIFKRRIVINNLYCANPRKKPFLFHISDWMQFGLTEDILNLWDIPLQKLSDASTYFKGKKRPAIDPVPTWLMRYLPEQHIWRSVLEKNGVVLKHDYYGHSTPEMLRLSLLSFANNCVIIDYARSGVHFLKYDPYKWDYSVQMNHALWLQDYQQFCHREYKIPLPVRWQIVEQYPEMYKLKRHAARFYAPLRAFVRPIIFWVRSPFLVLYYCLIVLSKILQHYKFTILGRGYHDKNGNPPRH